jgi:hypothetical protein
MGRAAIAGQRCLKRFDLRTEDKFLGCKDFVDLGPDGSGQGGVLFSQVEQRDAHGSERMAVSTGRSMGTLAAIHPR